MALPTEVEELFTLFDSDGDGCIGLDEFESLVATILDNYKQA